MIQELSHSPTRVLDSDQWSETGADDEGGQLKALDTIEEDGGSSQLSTMIERIRRIGDSRPIAQLRRLH